MPRNGSGTYALPVNSWNPATNGTLATTADWQSLINDVATAVTNSVAKDGQTVMTGSLDMGGFNLSNVASAAITALSGPTTAPTAAPGTNTDQIATTAHVFAERTNTATLTNKTLTAPVINSPTGLVKADVGLGNVDNTSDANKPVSTATQTALNGKQDLDADLTALAGLATTGLIARTGAGAAATRTLTAGAGVTITNGDGVAGNPTIAVSGGVGLGDVLGPASSTDNAIARYDLTTGKILQNSNVTVGDAGEVSGVVSINGGQLAGLRNKIINGNFGINQRSYVSGAATTAGQYTLDRWKVTGTGGVTFSTTANKTTVTIPSGQTLQQVVEGLNLESGTYVLSWEGTAQGRIAGGAYGASGAVTASITGGTNTTIEFNTGTVALVMLEKGTVATPFEHRPYGMELALCQRYYYRVKASAVGDNFGIGYNIATNGGTYMLWFPTVMRIAPTALEQSGTVADYSVVHGSGNITPASAVPIFTTATDSAARLSITVASGLTAGDGSSARASTTNAYLGFSAEL